MDHLNVLHTFMKTALRDEQQFQVRMLNRTELKMKLNQENEEEDKWPEFIKTKFEDNQERAREILGMIKHS